MHLEATRFPFNSSGSVLPVLSTISFLIGDKSESILGQKSISNHTVAGSASSSNAPLSSGLKALSPKCEVQVQARAEVRRVRMSAEEMEIINGVSIGVGDWKKIRL